MRVHLGLVDEGGCGHYRIKYPAAAAKAIGVDTEVVEEMPMTLEHDFDAGTTRIQKIDQMPECDVFVFQRPLRALTAATIPHLQAAGVAVVVDVDDDFSSIAPNHAGWVHYDPKRSRSSNREHLERACQLADWVTVTTPELAERYGAHGRVSVLPNFAASSFLEVPKPDAQGPVVGWPGFVSTHPNDLQVCQGGVASAISDLGGYFLHIGAGPVQRILGLPDQRFEQTGSVSMADYPLEIARLDVGIVPLASTQFNRAKSRLKGLELAALGVPFVASPLPEYERLAEFGIGTIAADRGRKWAAAIKYAASPEGRRQADAARELVAAELTYDTNGDLWADAWGQAAARRGAEPTPKTGAISG